MLLPSSLTSSLRSIGVFQWPPAPNAMKSRLCAGCAGVLLLKTPAAARMAMMIASPAIARIAICVVVSACPPTVTLPPL